MATLEVDIYKTKLKDLSVQVLSKLSTNKHSFCWSYFGHLVVNTDGKKRTVLGEQVFCDVCLKREKEKHSDELYSNKSQVKAYSKNIATSNLQRHLKDEHNLQESQHKSKVIPIREFFSVQRTSKPITKSSETSGRKDKWLLSRDLALWFARSLMPFDSIDDEAMIDFFIKYNIVTAKDDLPSRQNIAREGLEDVYNSMLNYVKNFIGEQNIKFGALTADLWTDQYRRRNYITCTLHFITREMELKKFTLSTKQVIEKHTGETIRDELHDILRMFDIPHKNIILVTDSGSNMKRAANLMNVQNHLCLGHSLHNLVTVDGIQSTNEIFTLIDKCKKMVRHLRYRAPHLEAAANKEQRELLTSFETIGEQLEDLTNETSSEDSDILGQSTLSNLSTNTPPTIKTSTPTRWHSMLMMLSSISHPANRRPIRDMLIDTGRSDLLLDENEHNLITTLITFLDKFKTIVEILSSDSQTTINLALVFKSEIQRLLDEYDDNEPVLITRLKNNMSAKLSHRFPATDIIVAATLLDCRFHSINEIDTCMESRDTTKVIFLSAIVKKMLKEDEVINLTPDLSSKPSTSQASSNILMDLAKKHSATHRDMESVVENDELGRAALCTRCNSWWPLTPEHRSIDGPE